MKKLDSHQWNKNITKLIAVMTLCFAVVGCNQKDSVGYQKINGLTMGTTYQVTLRAKPSQVNEIHTEIDVALKKINQLMSTYIDDSELSIFNQNSSLECQPLSDETFYVISNAQRISQQTNGKFDTTVSPLIAEWGFDKKETNDRVPSDETIEKLLRQIGFEKIFLGQGCVTKGEGELSINLSAIAKGFGVDYLAKLLEEKRINDYLVEIGGETASSGLSPKKREWRLAIEAPTQQRKIQQVFAPMGLGVATSGDYRNYFEKDGKRFSHTIDPTTGKPIKHNLVSVTVLHPETMIADAYATAFMVMGAEASLSFAETNQLPIYLMTKTDDGYSYLHSSVFESHIIKGTSN